MRFQKLKPFLIAFLIRIRFVSFDIASLFTNVPLRRTIEIILERVFEDKLINTTLTKRTLKKLLLDCATKTAFSFDYIFYVQTDGVSMSSSLALVLANIILTEFEEAIVPVVPKKSTPV